MFNIKHKLSRKKELNKNRYMHRNKNIEIIENRIIIKL